MVRWEQTEFLLKGLYLGFLVLVAWQIPTQAELGAVGLYTAGGLVLCLAAAAVLKFRGGYRVHGKPLGFLLFLILENPGLVYMGILIGLAVGTGMTFNQRTPPIDWEWDSVIPVAGGVVLGVVFYAMRYVRDRRIRLWLGLGLVVVLTGSLVGARVDRPAVFTAGQLSMIGVLLLSRIPGV